MKEHRRFNRADFHTKGHFIQNERETPFSIINISLNGILVESENNKYLKLNDLIPLHVCLSSSQIEIHTMAKLLHKEENQLGFSFEEMDVESMIHLRRLVELNSDSADQISEELSFLRKE